MPRFARFLGTGITKLGIFTYDWSEPGDVEAQVDAAVAAYRRTRFDLIGQDLTKLTQQILLASSLPTDLDGPYILENSSTWKLMESAEKSECANREPLNLTALAVALGFEIDSPQGYAIQILASIRNVDEYLKRGERTEALAAAFRVGCLVTEASIKELWEADALRGEKVIEGAKRGHAETHGTTEAKRKLYNQYKSSFDKFRAQGMSIGDAEMAAGNEHGVKPRTIRRARNSRPG